MDVAVRNRGEGFLALFAEQKEKRKRRKPVSVANGWK
jgi:hypothetical protein